MELGGIPVLLEITDDNNMDKCSHTFFKFTKKYKNNEQKQISVPDSLGSPRSVVTNPLLSF